ncbi:peptidoglycan DD-metalloendopeptidase family protein [Salinispira pacifica]
MRILTIGLTAAVVLCAGALQHASAWQWPLDPVRVSGSFGGNTADGFRDGVTLESSDGNVTSISSGQVIFSGAEGSTHGLPWTLGNFVVVQHREGFRSVYAHLADGSVPARAQEVTEGGTLGRAGETGRTNETGVKLIVIDSKESRVVNPLVVLPPVTDRVPPKISASLLSDRYDVPLVEGATVSEGHWAVAATVTDQIGSDARGAIVAPFEVELSVNGKRVTHLRFTYLSFRDGEYYVDPDFRWSYGNLYVGRHRYDLGLAQLIPGENTITITASDFAGNRTVFEQKVYYGQPPQPPVPAAPSEGAP